MIEFYFDKFLIKLTYLFSIFIFLNFSSFFVFWFWLEVRMILFLCLIASEKVFNRELDNFSQSLYYFIIQSISSILLLLFFSMEMFTSKNILILFLLIIKLGVVPFHFWSYKICQYLRIAPIFVLLNFQKIPIIIFLSEFDFKLILILILVNMIIGCLYLMWSNCLVSFIVSSRICFFSWIIFILFWRILGFILFFFKYLLFNLILISLKNCANRLDYRMAYALKLIFLTIFVLGLPPFFYFFFKFYLICAILQNGNLSLIFVVWMFSFFCLVAYFNFFSMFIFMKKEVYSSHQLLKIQELTAMFFILFCIIAIS